MHTTDHLNLVRTKYGMELKLVQNTDCFILVKSAWNGAISSRYETWSRYGMGLEHYGVGMEWDWSIVESVWNGTGAL